MECYNVTNMSKMFKKCSSLSSLPDISLWNINNKLNLKGMFDKCPASLILPNISKDKNIFSKFYPYDSFENCFSLLNIPDELK